MAVSEHIFRIKKIEHFLWSKGERGATFEEIYNYLKENYDIILSKRTFLRDKKLLSDDFFVEISVTKDYRYYIDLGVVFEEEDVFDNILLVEALKNAKFNRTVMHYEMRRSRGLKHLNTLVYAIKEKKIIKFQYISFYSNCSDYQEIVVEPYALKEFKYRWYLLGKNRMNNQIHAFGLERMKDIIFFNSTYKGKPINVDELFKNVFGIEFPNGRKPVEIQLKVSVQQGKYLKSIPIHHSQKIIKDTKEFLTIQLFLVPNYAFYQELFSLMDKVEVLSPPEVRDEMIKLCEKILINQTRHKL